MINKTRHWIGAAILVLAGALTYPAKSYVLIAALLFLPIFDHRWRLPNIPRQPYAILASLIVLAVGIGLVISHPGYLDFALATLLWAALPEEWFFRAYFMERVGHGWRANLTTSLLFSLLHGLTRGWAIAIQVFVPSLFYGWLYQRTRDFPLLVLVHALSNLVFSLYLAQILDAIWPHGI